MFAPLVAKQLFLGRLYCKRVKTISRKYSRDSQNDYAYSVSAWSSTKAVSQRSGPNRIKPCFGTGGGGKCRDLFSVVLSLP